MLEREERWNCGERTSAHTSCQIILLTKRIQKLTWHSHEKRLPSIRDIGGGICVCYVLLESFSWEGECHITRWRYVKWRQYQGISWELKHFPTPGSHIMPMFSCPCMEYWRRGIRLDARIEGITPWGTNTTKI